MQRFADGHTAQLTQDFDRVAARYDLLQQFNPGYFSDLVRSARRLGAPADGRILDLCCGTGLSTKALRECYPQAQITAVDISTGMLATARRKPGLRDVRFIAGDAMALDACGADGPFDGAMMAYGIRNVPDPDECLVRLRERLKPSAPVVFHEYSVADSVVGRAIWNLVAGAVIVPLGAAVTGSPELFRYLRKSVNDFDSLAQFQERLRKAGFEGIRIEPMPGWRRGIVHSMIARA